MRWARAVAWSSTAGFHQGSRWMTVSAAVRFRPKPPALSEIRKTSASPRWKAAMRCSRASAGVVPSSTSTRKPCCRSRGASSSRKLRNWLNTRRVVPVLAQLGQQLQQVGRLRRAGVGARVDQARVAAQLAQAGQRRQQHEAHVAGVAVGVPLGLPPARPGSSRRSCSYSACSSGDSRTDAHDLGARRQLGRHLGLGPPQDERAQQRRQRLRAGASSPNFSMGTA